MNIRRALTITRRIFRGLSHDWRASTMMFLTPVMSIVVFGLAFSGDVKDVRVVVVNQDEGYQIPPSRVRVSISSAVVANLDTDVVKVDQVATEAEGVSLVRSGKAYGVIIFPDDFTSNVYENMMDPSLSLDTRIRVELDKSNVNVASAIQKTVGDALLKASSSMGVEAAITVDASNAIYGKDAEFRDFFLPGIASFILFILTFILTITSFVGERTSGCLARLQVSPLRESEFVTGYVLAFSVVGLLQTALILGFSVVVFKIMVVGSILLAFGVISLLAILSLSLGILLSSLARREAQAVQFLPIAALPPFLVSGIFWPVEAIPAWLQPLSYLVPTTYAVNAARSVMLRGWGVGQIWVDLVVMAGFIVVLLILSVWSLQRARG
jgi:ABC-2 type transport system permease protein